MRAYYSTIVQIVYLVIPVGGAIYGMAAHESYGMGLAICGIIGAVLGFIAATLLILVSVVVIGSLFCPRRFPPNK
jgi:hypothetical protein